jgi:RNA polymerase sigma-70 factor (TIGR02943 family)
MNTNQRTRISPPLHGNTPPHRLDPENWNLSHREMLLRFALARVGDYALAEDLVQDAFLSAWQNRKGFRGDCTERTWLTGILRNKIIDHYRRASSRLSVLAGDLDSTEAEDGATTWLERQPDRRSTTRPEAEAERRDFLGALQEALGALPPKMRRAFAMRELQGRSTQEITRELKISKANLWVLIHRARHALGEILSEQWRNLDSFGGIPRS